MTSRNLLGARRLLKLAAFLRGLKREQFDIGVYQKDCGTVCCALGWCPTVFPNAKSMECELITGASRFFVIRQRQALRLFFDGGYKRHRRDITPKLVAAKITRLANKMMKEVK